MIWPGKVRGGTRSPDGPGHRSPLLGMPDQDHAEFEILCGKGTYVRAWVRDIALALGTVGHVSALRRTRIGRL